MKGNTRYALHGITSLHAKMMLIFVHRDMITRSIHVYTGEGDPIQYIQKHKSSFLGRTSDDNHFTIMFPVLLMVNSYYWFFGSSMAPISLLTDLKMKFIQPYMGKRHLLRNVRSIDDVRQGTNKILMRYCNLLK